MCDKKNSVLFTNTACVVLSLDFKLTDESHVLLKVPRKNNMYSVDLNNVVPQGAVFNDEYDIPSHTKKVFANMRRKGKDFSGIVTPLFPSTLASQAVEGDGSGQPTEPQHTPTTALPSHVEPIPTVASSSYLKRPTNDKGDNVERAATIAASLDAEQDSDMNDVFKDVERDAEQVISATTDEVSTGDAVNTADTEDNTTSAPVTTAGISVSTAEPNTPLTTTTTIIEDEDLTIAQTLMKMRSEKSKAREVVMREPSETTTRPIVPPQKHDPKNKGKDKMVEQEKPLKKKDQIKFDGEVAQRLQAELHAELEDEERMVKQREENANITEWDNVPAMIDADYELAKRLQEED
uniref:Ribonuclease H-like domain-containing protein n=1 Tax=Tanacetum cinerariifolium TaxID=118510 RepID=A0A6L2J5Z2_TANCI|nr:ribonuclease H-like domain-containing protein [Tanacetum cinerariifolium]